MTNKEKIQRLSTNDLTKYLFKTKGCPEGDNSSCKIGVGCKECWSEWLDSQSDEKWFNKIVNERIDDEEDEEE